MSAGPAAQPLRVNDRALRRAEAWLRRHGFAGVPPTPLLAARLALRRRALAILVTAFVVIAAVAIAVQGAAGTQSAESFRSAATRRLLVLIMVIAVSVLTRWLWHRGIRHAESRLAATLTTRTAHPAAVGWRTVLGGRAIAVAAILHGGSAALAIAATVLAPTAQDAVMAAVLLFGILILTSMIMFEVADVLRRPALAEDGVSLAVDDALRAEDARMIVLSPVPAVLAALAVTSMSPEVRSALIGACFALVGFAVIAVPWARSAVASGHRTSVTMP